MIFSGQLLGLISILHPEPEHLIKDRDTSSKNNNQTIGQFPFVPFSVGQRNCPAFVVTEVLLKVAIAKFVADYALEFVKKAMTIQLRILFPGIAHLS